MTEHGKKQRIAAIRAQSIGNHVAASNSAQAASSKPQTTQKEPTTMAIDPKNQSKNAATPGKPAPTQGAKPANGTTPADPTKGAKKKRPRVRWVSDSIPGFWVRSYKDVTDKYGAPKGPDGKDLVARAGVPFGGVRDPGAKAAREAAKAAEKARIAAMSDADKLAYAKDKREKKQAEQAAKAAAEKAALVAQIKADIAAGRL